MAALVSAPLAADRRHVASAKNRNLIPSTPPIFTSADCGHTSGFSLAIKFYHFSSRIGSSLGTFRPTLLDWLFSFIFFFFLFSLSLTRSHSLPPTLRDFLIFLFDSVQCVFRSSALKQKAFFFYFSSFVANFYFVRLPRRLSGHWHAHICKQNTSLKNFAFKREKTHYLFVNYHDFEIWLKTGKLCI